MPYSEKEKKLYRSLVEQYGEKKGEQIYHAMLNKAISTGKRKKLFSAKSIERTLRKRVKKSIKEHKLG
ncbi:MAG: hypothetical protein QW279_01215 [Candidatus Jordarchaeaceae archaeon]